MEFLVRIEKEMWSHGIVVVVKFFWNQPQLIHI
jgi:hypothetical protein